MLPWKISLLMYVASNWWPDRQIKKKQWVLKQEPIQRRSNCCCLSTLKQHSALYCFSTQIACPLCTLHFQTSSLCMASSKTAAKSWRHHWYQRSYFVLQKTDRMKWKKLTGLNEVQLYSEWYFALVKTSLHLRRYIPKYSVSTQYFYWKKLLITGKKRQRKERKTNEPTKQITLCSKM